MNKSLLSNLIMTNFKTNIINSVSREYPKVDTTDMEKSMQKIADSVADAVVKFLSTEVAVMLKTPLTGTSVVSVATSTGPAAGTGTVTISSGQLVTKGLS